MASVKMSCRVCGKEYEPCRTASRRPDVFHWQEVACSPECGAIYLQRILESRKPAATSFGATGQVKRGKHDKKTSVMYVEAEPAVFEHASVNKKAENVEFSAEAPEALA